MKKVFCLVVLTGAMASPIAAETVTFTVGDGDGVAVSAGAPMNGAPALAAGKARPANPGPAATAPPASILSPALWLALLSTLAVGGFLSPGRRARKRTINAFDTQG